jgi:hypothetical protein
VVAKHSPDGVVETGLRLSLQRKRPQRLPTGFGGTLSPGRFAGKTWGIAAISSDFQRNATGFVCNPDCLAEREGFESAVKRTFNNIQSNGWQF